MRKHRKDKRHWCENYRKIKNLFNPVVSRILVVLSPLCLHLSLSPIQTQYFWILSFALISVLILIFHPKMLLLLIFISSFYLIFKFLRAGEFYENGNYFIKAKVTKVSQKYAILNVNNNNFLIYLTPYTTKYPLRPGQLVEVQAKIIKITQDNNFYFSNNINYLIEKGVVTRVDEPLYSFFFAIENWSKKGSLLFQKYWKLIVFGQNYEANDITKRAIEINILYLLVISGLHFDILFNFIFTLIGKIKNKNVNRVAEWFGIFICFLYLCSLINFISGLRAFIMQVFSRKFKKYKIYSIPVAAIVIFYVNFNLIISISFILSFSTTIIIILVNKNLKIFKVKNIFLNYLIISVLIYFYTCLWTLKLNNFINITGFLYAIFFAPVVEIIYLFSLLFWFSPDFLHFIYFALDQLINIASYFNLLVIFDIYISQNSMLIWLCLWGFLLSFNLIYRHFRKIKKI
ncbi:hypothetical protein MCFN_02550 [Mycoplasmopsis californica]|uniref:ComEC/Rec2-related protein domain-containing protein n=1 Tax=Mycoplasmopsis californica TaxID=2113 RepID=A0A059XWE0_9BACT|nr:hypothetical protein MCFN_02550 [Mycoplasmopsis californica]